MAKIDLGSVVGPVGPQGPKPVKGTDYYTEEEKQQFTTETVGLVTTEGTKQTKSVTDEGTKQVQLITEKISEITSTGDLKLNAITTEGKNKLEAVTNEGNRILSEIGKILETSPEGGNALQLGGKTRSEFDKEIQGVAGGYAGKFPLDSAVLDGIYLLPDTGKFYVCTKAFSGKSLIVPDSNFEELSVYKNRERLGNLSKELPDRIDEYNSNAVQKTSEFNIHVNKKFVTCSNDLENKTSTEVNKVIEQVKSIVAGNPVTTNALTLSGKTRVEFEQDTEKVKVNLKNLSKVVSNIIRPKNINLIPKSSFIWQYGNQLTKNLLHYQYKYNRMCLKPEFWIKVEKGEEYIFEYSDTIYKYAIQIHDGVSILKDSEWITSGEKYKFISTGEYINIVCARNDNVAFNLEEFYNKIYNLKLYKSDAVEEIIDVNTINLDVKTFVLDKEKTKKGVVETIENGNITSSTAQNRAHYSEIIDVSNIDVIYFDTNLYKNYDIAICTFNEDNQKKDYTWGNPDKILILPYTKYLTVSFREKNNSYINYDCLLYNNYLALGLGEIPKINIEKKTKSEFPAKYLHIAHRGYQTVETENSIPAFIGACTIGFDAIETDIHLSKDGILYCMHDDTVDRTTNGTGNIADMLSTDIDKLIINSKSSHTNEEMHVPKLTEFLAICKKYNKIPVIEIKPINIDYVFVDALINDINRFGLEKKCIVISFSKDALSLLRKKNQNIHIQPLFDLSHANILFADAYGNAGVDSGINNLTNDLVREAHEYGLIVGVNVVTDKATSDKFLEYGLDMVTSNEYYGI